MSGTYFIHHWAPEPRFLGVVVMHQAHNYTSLYDCWVSTLMLCIYDNVSHIVNFRCLSKTFTINFQVRSITADVRQSIAVTNLEQFSLLQEFSSIR
jgi:hypothetical protein